MSTGRPGNAPRVLFHVQHLLGVGHVFRAQRLAQGLTASGFHVEIAFGGVPLPDMQFAAAAVHLLPPIRAGAIDYSLVHDGEGRPLTADYQAMRADRLREIFLKARPDVVLVEQFPFGRRVLRPEIEAMFDQADRQAVRPLFVSSVRDILQERRKPGRAEEAAEIVEQRFDFVLVHSDPDLIRLDETFPLAERIAGKLRYTGIVAASPARDAADTPGFDVIVSAGGGAFGGELLDAARAAAMMRPSETWYLITGPNMPEKVVADLAADAPSNLTVVRFVDDLRACLAQARVSVSQAGYNTVADILAAGCRAVLVPYDTTGQTEQPRRAALLASAGRVVALPQSDVTPERLAAAVERAAAMPEPPATYRLDGVASSVAILSEALAARSGSAP